MSKVLALFFYISVCLSLHAQNRMKEMINVAYAWNPGGYFSAFDAKLGAEFFKYSSGEWSAVLNMREADLLTNKLNSDLGIHLKSYKLSLPFVNRNKGGWVFIASPSVSVRNASHSFVMKDDSLYFSFFGLGLYRAPGPDTRWSFGMGLIYSKEIEEHFFLPIISANYTKLPLRLNLGFPNFGVYYQPSENWEIGVKANFDSSTYTFAEGNTLTKGQNPGLKIRVIDVGPAFNVRLSDHIWMNTNLGIVALAEAHTVNKGGRTQDLLYRGNNSVFFRVSLSYYPFLK